MRGKGGSKKSSSSGSDSGSDSSGGSNVRTASNSAVSNAVAALNGQGQTASGALKPDLAGGAKSLVGKYGGSAVKGAGKAVLGAGLGAVGGIAGFAAGVAQGDIGKALSGAVAGGAAGVGLGKSTIDAIPNTVGNIRNSINNIQDTFNEGAYGAEKAQSLKDIREFKGSSDYKSLKEKYQDSFTDDKLEAMLKAGIKDKGDIEKVLSSDNTADAIGYYTLAKKCPDSIYYDKTILKEYVEDLAEQVGLSKNDADKIVENMKKFR